MSFNKEIEPLLKEDHNRFVLFPIKYQDIYDLWKLSLASFWTAEEIKFSNVDQLKAQIASDIEKAIFVLADKLGK